MNKINHFIKATSILASNKVEELINRAKLTEHFFMISLAVLVGILAGFGAVGVRLLIVGISDLCFPGDGSLLDRILMAPWYMRMLIPAIGGVFVGPLIYFFAPEAKGHGVPEVMQAVIKKGGSIRPRVAIVKAFASAISIGTGGSVGREGPIIQIGSSLGSTVGQFFRVTTTRMKILVGCGAAGGIAAAFNAPVAGALFAFELILMNFNVKSFSPVVIAAVMATVVSHYFEGDFAAFRVPNYHMIHSYEVIFYFILGVLSGLVSYLFIKFLYYSEDLWDDKFKIKQYYKPAIGGLLVGLIALLLPQIMGMGYDSIDAALNSRAVWSMALILIFIKILATSITLGSGGSGGIFAPSLFMGAMLGAAFGYGLNALFPGQVGEPGAYALVAMGGLVAGTTRAPITAIIIVFELTKETSIILPLMITCTISMILSSKLNRESIYTLKLLQRNIQIKGNTEQNILKSISVQDVFKRDFQIIPENANFSEVVHRMISESSHYIFVRDMHKKFLGMITIDHIHGLLLESEELKNVIIAGDIAKRDVHKVYLDNSCSEVLDMISHSNFEVLPVFDRANPNKQIGVVSHRDISYAYQKEIERVELTEDLASKIMSSNLEHDVQFMAGYMITEVRAPQSFIGRSIMNLQVRSRFGVDVLSVKSTEGTDKVVTALPKADYIIQPEDILIVAGEVEKINILKDMV